MHVVKEQFQLLKGTPNFLDLAVTDLKDILLPKGSDQVYAVLKLQERRIHHFTQEAVFTILNSPKTRSKINVIVYPSYILPVSYNRPTKSIIINLSAFQVDDISRVDPRNIYACLIYGLTFSNLAQLKTDASPTSAAVINYLLSVLVRLFGKKYGLLGEYRTEINRLKFLLSCYIFISFFGVDVERAYLLAASSSFFDFKTVKDELDKFDFTNIEEFIRSLSFFKVMPGINKYTFTNQFVKFFSVNFMPSLEDISRLVSSLVAASFRGSNIIPSFISVQYNEDEYNKILKFGASIFKGITT